MIRILLQEQSAFDTAEPIAGAQFSSPFLGKIFDALREYQSEGYHLSISLLSPLLEPEEMSHLTELLQKPENLSAAQRAIADYSSIIQEEYSKRSGTAGDPLLAAMEKNKNKSGYGGKQHG